MWKELRGDGLHPSARVYARARGLQRVGVGPHVPKKMLIGRCAQYEAIASISIRASLGSLATCTVARAGAGDVK